MRVQQLKNRNQFLITDGNKIIFQSYNSRIALIDNSTKTLTLGRHWDYSITTKKHLTLFLTTWLPGEMVSGLFLSGKITPDTIKLAIKQGLIKYDENMIWGVKENEKQIK